MNLNKRADTYLRNKNDFAHMKKLLLYSCALLLCSCGNNRTLGKRDIERLKEIGLWQDGENVMFFYSSLHKKTDGNLISDRRMASYWIDADDSSETEIRSAFYTDIDTIRLNDRSASLTYASYIQVETAADTFNVYMEGNSTELNEIYTKTLEHWQFVRRR